VAFVSLLQAASIDVLVDVARLPYFGGYLAHMETPLFTAAAQTLIDASRDHALCIMCAEADAADCHRSHISDWLGARGERVVLHPVGEDKIHEHPARLF
jgi:uncharacterized protein (DUF488 family)